MLSYSTKNMTSLPAAYKSNFAWIGPHLQRLSFPKGYEILAVQPEGGKVGSYYGRPTVVWKRQGEFWGEIEVRLNKKGAE